MKILTLFDHLPVDVSLDDRLGVGVVDRGPVRGQRGAEVGPAVDLGVREGELDALAWKWFFFIIGNFI